MMVMWRVAHATQVNGDQAKKEGDADKAERRRQLDLGICAWGSRGMSLLRAHAYVWTKITAWYAWGFPVMSLSAHECVSVHITT